MTLLNDSPSAKSQRDLVVKYCSGEILAPQHSPCNVDASLSLHIAWRGSQRSEGREARTALPETHYMANLGWEGHHSFH